MNNIMTLDDVALLLKVDPSVISKLIDDGKLKAAEIIPGHYRISSIELARYWSSIGGGILFPYTQEHIMHKDANSTSHNEFISPDPSNHSERWIEELQVVFLALKQSHPKRVEVVNWRREKTALILKANGKTVAQAYGPLGHRQDQNRLMILLRDGHQGIQELEAAFNSQEPHSFREDLKRRASKVGLEYCDLTARGHESSRPFFNLNAPFEKELFNKLVSFLKDQLAMIINHYKSESKMGATQERGVRETESG